MPEGAILVINTGSSSLKCGLYEERDGDERLLLGGLADGIGRSDGKLEVRDAEGPRSPKRNAELPDARGRAGSRDTSLGNAFSGSSERSGPPDGARRAAAGGASAATSAVLMELRACVHFAPLHIPGALDLIDRAERAYPNVPQFACFDTAFHQTMHETAARLPIPRELFDEGIRRYGFHGLSYESMVHELGAKLPSRTVMAHLGSGASLVALKDGRSVDTSMGLTPTGGIPMATRTGDLDPGVVLYLMRVKQMNADALETMLNHDSGLMALSGVHRRHGAPVWKRRQKAENPEAELAIEVFCGAIRKNDCSLRGGAGAVGSAGFCGRHRRT